MTHTERGWFRECLELIDRHVPIKEIPEALDLVRAAVADPETDVGYTPVRAASLEKVVGRTCIGWELRGAGTGAVDSADEVVFDFDDGSELSVTYYHNEVVVEGD